MSRSRSITVIGRFKSLVFRKRPVFPDQFPLAFAIILPRSNLFPITVFKSLRWTSEKLILFLFLRPLNLIIEIVSWARLVILVINMNTMRLSNLLSRSNPIVSWFLSSKVKICTCYLNFSKMILEARIPFSFPNSLYVLDLNWYYGFYSGFLSLSSWYEPGPTSFPVAVL